MVGRQLLAEQLPEQWIGRAGLACEVSRPYLVRFPLVGYIKEGVYIPPLPEAL